MASPQPSTSKEKEELKQPMTLRLIKRIIQKCEEDKTTYNSVPGNDYMARAARYTGLHPKVLLQIKNDVIKIDKVEKIDRAAIYTTIAYFYIHERRLPTTYDVFDFMHKEKKIPPYVDIRTLRKVLVKMDYVWKRVNEDIFVLLERPTTTFERYNYLKNIIRYREEKTPIMFVHHGNFTSKSIQNDNVISIGVYYAVFRTGIYAIKFVEKTEDEFEKWVTDELLRVLPSTTVIVYDQSKEHSKELLPLPKFDSLKIEMIEWLEHHKVPHDIDMSKSELYTLIEKYTSTKENIYKIDAILKSHGHIPLRLPKCINDLTPAILVYELMKKNAGLDPSITFKVVRFNQEYLGTLFASIPVETLETYDKYIATQEKKVYDTDIQIDNVLDDLLANSSSYIHFTQYDEDSDLPTFSDSD